MGEAGAQSESRPQVLIVSSSTPTRVLRLEALVLAVASVMAYDALDGGWGMYFSLWLLPDVLNRPSSPKAGLPRPKPHP